jgi:hypothetical protein
LLLLLLYAASATSGCRSMERCAPRALADGAVAPPERQNPRTGDLWNGLPKSVQCLAEWGRGDPHHFNARHDAEPCLPMFAADATDFRASDDLRALGPTIWRDAEGIAQPDNLMILGVSLAAAIGIRQDLDGDVRQETAAHPQRWGDVSRFLGHLGEAPYQVPVLGVLWGVSLWTDDPELHSLSSTLVSAYTINGLATLAIKAVADTERPDPDWNRGRWGFPSFHASSAFTIAGVLEEYYGWDVGLPAYTLAGLISWSRIDERDHDLSDVVFGAAMGWVIGKSVAGQHLRGDGSVRVVPWVHPTDNAAGLLFDARF